MIGAHAINDRTRFSSKPLGKIHRRSTLEEFRLSLFVYRPSSPTELTQTPFSREFSSTGPSCGCEHSNS